VDEEVVVGDRGMFRRRLDQVAPASRLKKTENSVPRKSRFLLTRSSRMT